MRNFKTIAILLFSCALTACAATPNSKDYTSFATADPHSILIVPVINHSEEAEAPDLFLTTLAIPLAERGYYVFPTNMVKDMMEKDGLADAHMVHSANTTRLAELFGADSVIYVEILQWESKYNVLASGVQVHFLYTIKDGRSGSLLWQDEENFYFNKSSSSGNIFADLIVNAVTAAVDNASSDYTPVAHAANATALLREGQGIPAGPYSARYKKDSAQFPSSGTGRLTDATSTAISYNADPNANLREVPEEGAPEEKSEEAAPAEGVEK
ncbi:DUF799 domain-containing protein [Paremcibacter congregatus]|uniref:Lipoprotein n=1 Tax=Paremcibacter congregatus TaxID=2043170 RepID=A0A2G4YLX9_9PROT|nr:GNA1162 family protein [Paremcibacter congregatus]PHZ83301.1 hypothetical protein CRD36_17190 [Paremcibacter congregatus]QDE28225.1 hypothetical protein FIV45_13595 [Paremcibacter congregatus]